MRPFSGVLGSRREMDARETSAQQDLVAVPLNPSSSPAPSFRAVIRSVGSQARALSRVDEAGMRGFLPKKNPLLVLSSAHR